MVNNIGMRYAQDFFVKKNADLLCSEIRYACMGKEKRKKRKSGLFADQIGL